MTTPSTPRKAGPYTGNGAQTSWPFTFKVFAAADVSASVADALGNITVLTPGSDFSVTLNSNQETSPGGSITYPISGAALPTGSKLAIIGNLEYDQPLDLPSGGNFSPLALENQLDRATMQIQQLKELSDRSAKMSVYSSAEDVEALTAGIIVLAEISDDISTVAGNTDNIDTVVDNIADVNTVAASIANINAVGVNITDVNTVADDLNAPVSEIHTVAENIANVNAVGENITNVNAAVANETNINAVVANQTNINAVAGNETNINAAVANETNINVVVANATNINTVAENIGSVNTVADNIADVNTVAGNVSLMNTVADNLSAWRDVTAGDDIQVTNFSGTGAQTTFALPFSPGAENNTQVFISGVYQAKSEYSVSGATLTFTAAPPAGTNNIEVVWSRPFVLGATDAALVSADDGAGGTEFSTVQGFVDRVRSADGAGAVGANSYQTQADVNADRVSVKRFGAVGDGVTDDTAAIQEAINYCKSKWTGVPGTNNGGQATLVFPQGMYKVSSTLSCDGANGLSLQGAGTRTTTIVFVGTNDDLFSYAGYIDCKVVGMTITTGNISFSGGLPQVDVPATRTNTAFRFNGDGGGTNFEFDNVAFWSFDVVFKSTDNIVNVDNHTHRHCRFYNNNYVWNNTNPQAVVWSFLNCKVFSTQTAVFNNAGGDLLVVGGDFINKGTFYRASLANMGYDALFSGVRFENYQNIDPASAPKFLELVSGGTYSNIVFDHCTARGGGSLTGKTSALLAGPFNVVLRDCASIGGTWEVTASSAPSGFLSSIIFERCIGEPIINQTLSGGVGNNPINLEYVQRRVANTTMNRRLYGRVNSLSGTAGIFGGVQSDSFGYAAGLNGISFGREYAVFCPSPYQLAIAGFDIVWTNNTVNTVVIDIYTDNTKASKIASVTTAAASGQRQVISIRPSDLLVRHTISSTSPPLFFEATAALNAGTCAANVNVNLLQV